MSTKSLGLRCKHYENVQAVSDDPTLSVRMDAFLASVEKRAYIMAKVGTGNSDAALDIVQDAMLGMLGHYGNKPEEQWPPLFFKVLNNRITDHHRKRGFARLVRWFGDRGEGDDEPVDAVGQLPTDWASPEQQYANQELGQALRQALSQLPERQRQAFLLRQWQGLSVAETAVAMGVSEGSVKTHLWRATQAMQARLQMYQTANQEV